MVLLETIFNPNVINNILVVEDNLDICQYLQTILKEEYNITFAHNGKEALTFLEKYQPNLIITDLMMPIMNGYELLERLKKDKRYRKIPIIALTARAEFSDKLKALKIGIDDYLLKPFEEKELKARIKNLLKNLESRMDFREEIVLSNETKPSPSSPTINIFNENNLSKEDLQWLEKLQEETLKGISNFDFNVNYLSEAMFLSPSQLYRRIKAFTGFTPKGYMQQVRFHQARKLLEDKRYSTVKTVSYSVGFKDEKYFARQFKQRFGKNPSEYL
jgi:YesN/AraC family two-component response regulator